jgi:flagellin-like protein
MMIKNKKGISPIVATVLLIVIAISLFVLIFLWIRGFQGESIEKFGDPIENACPNVQLQINLIGNTLQIENIGNVPVYKIQILKITNTGTTDLGEEELNLLAGETNTDISITCTSPDRLKIIPILLGTIETGAQKEYICENKPIIVSCLS